MIVVVTWTLSLILNYSNKITTVEITKANIYYHMKMTPLTWSGFIFDFKENYEMMM